MLTESFIISTLNPSKQAQASHSKDLGIHLHDYQPNSSLKSSLKKSSTHPNCLAASASHIFAAQSEKAVVHTYNRELGSLEAVVPFPERIRSLAFAGDAEQDVGVLVLGTEAGGLVLWEVCQWFFFFFFFFFYYTKILKVLKIIRDPNPARKPTP